MAVFCEPVHERSGRCNWIPRTHSGTSINAAECGGGVAGNHHTVPGLIHCFETDWKGTIEMLLSILVSECDSREVRIHEMLLGGEFLLEHPFHNVHVDV